MKTVVAVALGVASALLPGLAYAAEDPSPSPSASASPSVAPSAEPSATPSEVPSAAPAAAGVQLSVSTEDIVLWPGGGGDPHSFTIRNSGDATPTQIVVVISVPEHVFLDDPYDECQLTDDSREARCVLTSDMPGPGEERSFGLPITIASDAPPNTVLGQGQVHVGSGDPLDDPSDNVDRFTIRTVGPHIDLEVAPAEATGSRDAEIPVKLKVSNDGPSDALDGFTLLITAPGGTRIVAVPEGCTAVTEGKKYRCEVSESLGAGDVVASELRLRTTSGRITDGLLEVSGAGREMDPGDNTAPIRIRIRGGGSGGGSGGGGSGGGGLPLTGADVAVHAAAGLALLTLGAGLVLSGRRRTARGVRP